MTELPHSAPADRNKQPILEVLRQVLPAQGRALEIASGTGQHVVWFAAGLPQWSWLPSDAQATQAQTTALATISARIAQAGLTNVHAPILLDVMMPQWLAQGTEFDAIYCANMLAGLTVKAVKDLLTRPDYLRTAQWSIKENAFQGYKATLSA